MTKKLVKHGTSAALILDNPILELLYYATIDTPLKITTDGRTMMTSPADSLPRQSSSFLNRINDEFAPPLNRRSK